MGLQRAASRSWVSSSSPKPPIADSSASSSLASLAISGFLNVVDACLDFDFDGGASESARLATTSFKAVVRDFNELGAVLLWLERVAILWDLLLTTLTGREELGIYKCQH